MLTGFPVMSWGAQAIIIFPMPHLTRSESTQTYYSGNLTVLVRAGTTLPLPNAGVLILPSSAVYFPARRGTRCICPHWLIRRKHYKLLRKKKKITPAEHMVSVLPARLLLLPSAGAVVPSVLSIQLSFSGTQESANTAWSNTPPYCTRRGTFSLPLFFFPCLLHHRWGADS